MAQAVTLAKLFEAKDVDWALGHAAVHARFAEADLASILDHHASSRRHHEDRGDAPGRAGRVPDPGHRRLGRARRHHRRLGHNRWGTAARRTGQEPTDEHHTHDRHGSHGSAIGTAPALGFPAAATLPEDLHALLRQLRLPHIRAHPPEIIATARAQRWEPVEVLGALFAEEPEACSIPAPTQPALHTLDWVGRRENLVVCGPSGTGKTFLLEALGQHDVQQGLKVAWFTLEDLGSLLRRHKADDSVTKAIARSCEPTSSSSSSPRR